MAPKDDPRRRDLVVAYRPKDVPEEGQFEPSHVAALLFAGAAFVLKNRFLGWGALFSAVSGLILNSGSLQAWQSLMFALTSMSTLYMPLIVDSPRFAPVPGMAA